MCCVMLLFCNEVFLVNRVIFFEVKEEFITLNQNKIQMAICISKCISKWLFALVNALVKSILNLKYLIEKVHTNTLRKKIKYQLRDSDLTSGGNWMK